MRLTVLIHRAETFYFDNYDMWQQRLGADLLRQYTDSDYDRDPADNVFVELGIRSLEDVLREARERELAFVSDERLDRFWAETADRLKERVGVNVDPDLTPELLLAHKQVARLIQRDSFWGKPIEISSIIHMESGAELFRTATFREQGVIEGDVVGIIVAYPTHGCYMISHHPTAEAALRAMRSDSDHPPSRASVAPWERHLQQPADKALFGALIYTDEDVELSRYVRRHFASLSQASGPALRFYVIETPDSAWRAAARWWRGVLDESSRVSWTTMGWLRTKPYSPGEAYELARHLGVFPDQLPCLVLFEDASSPEKLVFPIEAVSTEYFRSLFSELLRAVMITRTSDRRLTFAGVRKRYSEILANIRSASVVAEEGEGRTHMNFTGRQFSLTDQKRG